MAASTNTKPTPPVPDTETAEPDKKALGLSLTQIVGGALAAMTAAYLGSRLSVAGTVIGAALASIVAGVAGTIYTASLQHTRDRVSSLWTGKAKGTPTEILVTSTTPDGPTAASAPAVTAPSGDTAAAATGLYETEGGGLGHAATSPWRTGRFWKRIGVGAVATFALAAATITGLELVSGQSLDGGQGTTVERVRHPQSAPSEKPSDKPSDSPSDAPSESSSDQPSEEPSEQPSEQPTGGTSQPPSPAPGEAQTQSSQPSEGSSRAAEPEGQSVAPNAADGDEAGAGNDADAGPVNRNDSSPRTARTEGSPTAPPA